MDQTHLIANATWQALCERSVAPTPRNFELLFTHFSGLNRSLSERLRPILDQPHSFTADNIDVLYDECIGNEAGVDGLDAGAEGIAQAAQSLVDTVSSNQEALSGYSAVLAHWSGQISASVGVSDLLRAVAALTAETGQAAERNRTLEQQLSASTVRIAKLRQDLVEMRLASTTDALTGTANRKAFESRLRRLLAQARSDTLATFSLIMLDVDHFKSFNDTHGHRTGDQVLRLVGRLLCDNVKGRDTAARYGGEEFAVLLTGADLRAAQTVAEQIRQRLSSQRLVKRGSGETVGQITVSVGVAQHRPGESGPSLIERADAALYEAKRTGRNRVCMAPPSEVDAAA